MDVTVQPVVGLRHQFVEVGSEGWRQWVADELRRDRQRTGRVVADHQRRAVVGPRQLFGEPVARGLVQGDALLGVKSPPNQSMQLKSGIDCRASSWAGA